MSLYDDAQAAARKTVEDACTAYQTQIDTLTAQVTQLNSTVATDKTTNAQLTQQLADLQAQFDAYKQTHPNQTQPILIGAVAGGGTAAEFTTLESKIGQQLMVCRSYDSGMPATWQTSKASWHPDRIMSWHSVKPAVPDMAAGTLDATITKFVQSIPASHRCMLTMQHEPENPNKGINPTQFRQAFSRFYDLVKAVRPDIKVGPIFMSWTFNPSSGRNPDDWWPTGKADFIGVDTYETYMQPAFGSPTTWQPGPEAAYVTAAKYGAAHGVPPAIGEFKAAWGPPNSTDHAAKVAWAKATVDFTASMNGIAACWFDTGDPRGTAPGGYIEDDPETIAYFASVLANPPQIPA